MKVTLELPDDLARAVKLRAVMLGKTMKELVTEVLEQGLGLPPRPAPVEPGQDSIVHLGDGGVPVVTCRPGESVSMSVEQLLKLEQDTQAEEDLKRAGISG